MTTAVRKFINPVKERLKAGGVALGITVRMARSAEIARIAKSSGHDFLFIDVQHSIYNLETIVTTQTDIGFLSAAATQWTAGVRKALEAK